MSSVERQLKLIILFLHRSLPRCIAVLFYQDHFLNLFSYPIALYWLVSEVRNNHALTYISLLVLSLHWRVLRNQTLFSLRIQCHVWLENVVHTNSGNGSILYHYRVRKEMIFNTVFPFIITTSYDSTKKNTCSFFYDIQGTFRRQELDLQLRMDCEGRLVGNQSLGRNRLL